MLTYQNFQENRYSKFQVALRTYCNLLHLWLLHPYWFQASKDFICKYEWQPCFLCCYFCKLPNRFIELSSCLCIKTQNMVASGTFSAAFYLTTADKINGEKTELGPSWLAILELHSPRWITYLGSLARHKDHVCGSWKSVGVPLLRIWPSVFYVVGDICFTSPGVSSMAWCGFASFPSFACCHKEYLQ